MDWFGEPELEVDGIDTPIAGWRHPTSDEWMRLLSLVAYPTYELLSDRGGQSGTTFEGLGDKAKRDFRKLDDVALNVTSKGGELVVAGDVGNKVEVIMRSLTIYDRIKTMFIARNVSLGSRTAEKPKAAAKEGEEEAVEEKEPVAA